MKVNPQQLIDDGYVVLRQVVPPEQLEALRTSFETLIEKQKVIWARERKPDEKPGGVWTASAQPRVFFDSKLTDKVRKLKDPEIRKLSVEERIGEISAHRLNFHLYEDFADRFSAEDAERIRKRFSTLYEKIEAEIARSVPDRTSRVMRYQLTDMPVNFEVEDFIRSW